MHRFLGLVLVFTGIVGGWLLGQNPQPDPRADLSPAAAWRHYRAELVAAQQFKHDIPPHPATVAILLAATSLGVMFTASSNPRHALAAAVWLRSHPSVRWN